MPYYFIVGGRLSTSDVNVLLKDFASRGETLEQYGLVHDKLNEPDYFHVIGARHDIVFDYAPFDSMGEGRWQLYYDVKTKMAFHENEARNKWYQIPEEVRSRINTVGSVFIFHYKKESTA
jgi:hypothetical protein